MERALDVILSGFALIVFAPILLMVCMLLSVTGEREIFYRQDRIGKGGNVFKLLKFATMKKNSPQIGSGTVTIKDDPRILPVGKYLRKTKINELPQLFNVLFGDMTIIGPRPLTSQTFGAYSEHIQLLIQKVKPGLSGIGSIVFRNEEEIINGTRGPEFYYNLIAPYKGELEEWYISNKTIRKYFMFIILTIVVVLIGKMSWLWKLYPDLPMPPDELKHQLGFISKH